MAFTQKRQKIGSLFIYIFIFYKLTIKKVGNWGSPQVFGESGENVFGESGEC
jgi:hypothetical protein